MDPLGARTNLVEFWSTLNAQGKLDWSRAFLDGSFFPAKKQGGQEVGLTLRRKGSKLMLLAEHQGVPIDGLVARTQQA